ncbi:hypothetical protein ASD07_15365 [Duganella sp. Root336D2]|nr:hypothetical protein ASD07_15365 [Duganella sp. Root336D2]
MTSPAIFYLFPSLGAGRVLQINDFSPPKLWDRKRIANQHRIPVFHFSDLCNANVPTRIFKCAWHKLPDHLTLRVELVTLPSNKLFIHAVGAYAIRYTIAANERLALMKRATRIVNRRAEDLKGIALKIAAFIAGSEAANTMFRCRVIEVARMHNAGHDHHTFPIDRHKFQRF